MGVQLHHVQQPYSTRRQLMYTATEMQPAIGTLVSVRFDSAPASGKISDVMNARDRLPVPVERSDAVTSVVYEYWKVTQSQFHYREAGMIELGEIGEVE